jgi:ABC-type multidrug transport system fused ATPase/permease subunit
MSRLIRELIRPYRGTLLVIFIAMMVETLMSLAGPWPLKIILDNVQRQRIGIARAVIRNTPILILDEPTAALDTESERLVIEALERLLEGRTVITIAHRLTTIRDANKIIVLSAGVVAEQGTHQELIALGGVYAELHRIQVDGVSETIAS